MTQPQPERSWGRVLWIALLVAVVLGGVVGLVVVKTNSGSNATLTLEPADASGSDPFTDSIANATNNPSAAAQAQFATTRSSFAKDGKTGALLAAATAPGLYGGTGDTKVCDPQKLVNYLNANPDKAQAWADVFDITTNDIPAYVASLTPVVLTSDTRVTNHGYKNGHATSYQAVLETGTAVLVDTNGIPRVKCNCGNPLTEPTALNLTNATLNGIQWRTYTPDQVVIVQPNIQITTFVIINTQTATTYNLPAPPPPQLGTGTTATTNTNGNEQAEGVWVAVTSKRNTSGAQSSETVFLSSIDGASWSEAGRLDGTSVWSLAYGNGEWLAATSDGLYRSGDLTSWSKVDLSGVQPAIDELTYGNGRWIAVGGYPSHGDGPYGLQTSTDGMTWTDVSIGDDATYIESLTYGDGLWTAIGSRFGDEFFADPELKTFQSTNGLTWNRVEQPLELGVNDIPHIAYHDSTWSLGLFGQGASVYTSPDGSSWSPVGDIPFTYSFGIDLVGSEAGFLLLSTTYDTPTTTIVYASADGRTWNAVGQLEDAGALAWGGS